MRSCAVLLFFTCLLICSSSMATRGYRVSAELPPWVVVETVPPVTDAGEPSGNRSDLRDLLQDLQTYHGAGGSERFFHFAQQLLTAAGRQNGSEIDISFYPDYQTLHIHAVRVHRDGKWIDRLKTSQYRVSDRERDRPENIYHNKRVVTIVIPDTRIGDVIEWSFTRTGDNPALKGHLQVGFTTATSLSIEKLRLRLLTPRGKHVSIGYHNTDLKPRVKELGSNTEYTWRADRVGALHFDGDTPAWYDPYPWIQISDFDSWQSVAAWALALYQIDLALPAELTKTISKWKSKSDLIDRMSLATRFVQNSIRYLGMEIGHHSLVPHPPAQVYGQRFGDCKDKTLLLIAILGELGVHAVPALVSTINGKLLDSWVPSSNAFNHVIVKATIGEDDYWLDPTDSYQRGDVSQLESSNFGFALVLDPDTRALEEMPKETLNEPAYAVTETFDVSDTDVRLSVRTAFREDDAEALRHNLETISTQEISKRWFNYYAHSYPDIKKVKAPDIQDDEKKNVITVDEHYLIDNFREDDEGTIIAWAIDQELKKPRIVNRIAPLAKAHPLYIRHEMIINWSKETDFEFEEFEDNSYRDDFIEYKSTGKRAPGSDQMVITYELRSLSDYVPADKVAEHLKLMEKVRGDTDYYLHRNLDKKSSAKGTALETWQVFAVVLLALGVVAGLVWVVVKTDRYPSATNRQRQFNRKKVRRSGEVPEKAIGISDIEAAFAHIENSRCSCGASAKLSVAERQPTEVLFNGETLFSVKTVCKKCGAKDSYYFNPRWKNRDQ